MVDNGQQTYIEVDKGCATSGDGRAETGTHSDGPDTICGQGWNGRVWNLVGWGASWVSREEPSISRRPAAFSGSKTSNGSGIDNSDNNRVEGGKLRSISNYERGGCENRCAVLERCG